MRPLPPLPYAVPAPAHTVPGPGVRVFSPPAVSGRHEGRNTLFGTEGERNEIAPVIAIGAISSSPTISLFWLARAAEGNRTDLHSRTGPRVDMTAQLPRCDSPPTTGTITAREEPVRVRIHCTVHAPPHVPSTE